MPEAQPFAGFTSLPVRASAGITFFGDWKIPTFALQHLRTKPPLKRKHHALHIDEVYLETPYFIEPEKGGEKAYLLLQKALEKSGKVGLSRFVMRMKEHLAIIRPKENYLMLQQLRFEEEVRRADELSLPDDIRIVPRELAVAMELIREYSSPFAIGQYKDEYKKELLKIIKAKAGGKKIEIKRTEVIVWDRGYYEPIEAITGKKAQEKHLLQQLEAGSLKIRMYGQKLQGEFALVRARYRSG